MTVRRRCVLVVQLQTAERDDVEDDGLRNLYVRGSRDPASQSLHAAVAIAVQAAGVKGLEVGGTLTVRYVGDGVARTRGFNPPKKYIAKYVLPDASAFLGTDQAPADMFQQPQQQPHRAQPAHQSAPQQQHIGNAPF